MDNLPLDLLYLIGKNLELDDIINYTGSCKRIYKLRDKLALEYCVERNYKKFKDKYNQFTIYHLTDIDRLHSLLMIGIESKIWYVKFTDMEDNFKNITLNVINNLAAIIYKPKITEYVLESIINIYQKISNRQLIHFCKYEMTPLTRKYIINCKHKPWFVFHLCRRVIRVLGIDKEYWKNYYSWKLNKLRNKYNQNILRQKHYELLCQCKNYLPDFYYQKLKTLNLSIKHWTLLFMQDYKYKQLCDYCKKIHNIYKEACHLSPFTNQQDIINYYKKKPLLKSHIKRKLNIDI